MNERIQELAEQAGLSWVIQNPFDEKNMQEFAELIVKECCEVAHCNFHVDGLTLGVMLKEHFGVEE